MAKSKAAAKAKAKAKVAKAAPKKPAIVNIKRVPGIVIAEKIKPPETTDTKSVPSATAPAPDFKAAVKEWKAALKEWNKEVGDFKVWQKKVDADIQWLKERSRP